MGNYFDGYVFSAQEKLMKPDRRIYERLIARYILNPEESIFIDDLKANTDAAKKLGMLAFTFKIDKLGYVIKDGTKTKEFWDGKIASDKKPKRIKIRNISGDETIKEIE